MCFFNRINFNENSADTFLFCLFYPAYNWWKLAAANGSSLWTQLISSQFFPIHFYPKPRTLFSELQQCIILQSYLSPTSISHHQLSALGNSCTHPGASFVSTSGIWLHCHYDSSQLEHALISHAWELEAEFACVMGIIWSSNLLIYILFCKKYSCVFFNNSKLVFK